MSTTDYLRAVASSDLLARVKQLYPDMEAEPFYGPGDYQPLIDSFGEVLLQVDDKDYQGDTRVILKRGDEYGLLIFGWGSCSGCDALQACDTYQDIENLRARLESVIKWMTAKDLLAYIETHDWHLDGLEVAGCSIRKDWPHGIVFEVAIGLDRLVALQLARMANAEVSDGGPLTYESPAAQSRRSLH